MNRSLYYLLSAFALMYSTTIAATVPERSVPSHPKPTSTTIHSGLRSIYYENTTEDSLALAAFYLATDGSNWTVTWDLSEPMSTWYGVHLDGNGRVICLDLDGQDNCVSDRNSSGNNLSGDLTDLNLPDLTQLLLSNNQLTGPIPDFLGMPQLQVLDLGGNQLEQSVPDFSGLPVLEELFLAENQLTGEVPDFSACPMLTYLNLHDNMLTGTIPDLSNLPVLLDLILSDNQLSGIIPNFSGLPVLRSLVLSNNQLVGCLPAFSHTPALQVIFVKNNQLQCTVPEYLNLPSLLFLEIEHNRFTFEELLPNLNSINRVYNSGGHFKYFPQQPISVPAMLAGTLGGSITIDLIEDDTVSSNHYVWYKDGMLLEEIDGANELTISGLTGADAGTYSCEITNDLVPNLILYTNDINLFVGDGSESCRMLDSLALVSLYQATDGPNWVNSWDLTQPIHTWYGVTLDDNECVKWLYLRSNKLKGILPDLNLPNLIKLGLNVNDIMSPLPPFSYTPKLDYLELGGNQLTGPLPDLSNLQEVLILRFSGNYLSGQVPDFSLPKLTKLWLDFNALSGIIPDFTGMDMIEEIYLDHNYLEGTIPDFSQSATLKWIEFSDNRLIGTIPDFTNLPALERMYLANNDLTGCLPPLSNSPLIRRILVQGNNLSCTVPAFGGKPQFTDLYLQGNQFTFEDLLPHFSDLDLAVYTYAPQQKIFADTLIEADAGTSLVIDLMVDDTVSSNVYQWYKAGEFYQEVTGSNELSFNTLQLGDSGDYVCLITNPNLPDLSLMSRVITLQVEEVILPDCDDDMLTLDQDPVPADTYRAFSTVESAGSIAAFTAVTFVAGESVRLLPGFHAQAESEFLAYIDDCQAVAESTQELPKSVSALKSSPELKLKVYPNPGRGAIYVEYKLQENSRVRIVITDLTGRRLVVAANDVWQEAGTYRRPIDLQGLPSGMYQVQLFTDQGRAQQRLVVLD
ncbi:3-coathanger stack domain-containing protein [Flavilitoribacter nigricans]|nr:3-coathanger stack domain-containing protein [Flavilitoribacter nigricans]